jgi:hypothetical protein
MLKERVSLASELWTDGFPCMYLHPAHLNQASLKAFAKEYMVRWIILFRREEYTENKQVQVRDLASSDSKASSSAARVERHSTSGSSSYRDQQDGLWMSIGEVRSYLRSRLAAGSKVGVESSSAVSVSNAYTSGSASTSIASQHSKPNFFCHIIDASSGIKSSPQARNQILTGVKRTLAVLLGTAAGTGSGGGAMTNYAVTAVELPFGIVRNLASAWYTGAHATALAIEECHARHRDAASQLLEYITRKCGAPSSISDSALPTKSASKSSANKATLAAAAALVEASREKVELLYIYSIPDRKVDVILSTQST